MPQLKTKYFGELEYNEDAGLHFPAGIPGFEDEKSFVLVEQTQTSPLVFMQSTATPGLCFLALPVRTIDPGYHLQLTVEEYAQLGLPQECEPATAADVLCLALLTLGDHEPPTANLLAPIVVNLNQRKAIQSIQAESDYSHRQLLPQERVEELC